MDKLFRIGDMARMFHLSMGSIRHYEAMGLLTPDQVDPATGYRYYSTRQFEIFNTIRYLRALDMPLEEIRDFLQNRDVDLIEAKLRQQKQIVVEKQRELKRIQRKIDNRLRQLEDAKASELDQIRETVSPACRLYWVSQSLQITSYHDMEEPTLRLAQCQNEAVIFLGKVGLGLTAEHLRQGQFQQYDGIFLVLDDEDHFEGETLLLPQSRCVTLRFRGSHTEAPRHYRRLMDSICRQNWDVTGFSREITMIDSGFTDDSQKFVTEITIPVQ